jgi:hypothetical protein
MPEIQRKVLTLHYLEGLCLREIAEVLDLTEGRICQIKTQAISSLRAYLRRYENETAREGTVQVQPNRPPPRKPRPVSGRFEARKCHPNTILMGACARIPSLRPPLPGDEPGILLKG